MGPATDLEFAEVEVAPALAAQLSGHSALDPASIAQAMRDAFETVMHFVNGHKLVRNGQPRAIYTAYDSAGVSFTVALPVTGQPKEPLGEPGVSVEVLPPVRAYRFAHRGPYSSLPGTYGHIAEFLKERGKLKSNADWARHMPMWEEYENDPSATPPAGLLTYIYLPV